MKPIHERTANGSIIKTICPSCQRPLTYTGLDKPNPCQHCGAPIDWSDDLRECPRCGMQASVRLDNETESLFVIVCDNPECQTTTARYFEERDDAERHWNKRNYSERIRPVYCRECKYNTSASKCLHPNSIIKVPRDNDFCSYGDLRKEPTYSPPKLPPVTKRGNSIGSCEHCIYESVPYNFFPCVDCTRTHVTPIDHHTPIKEENK